MDTAKIIKEIVKKESSITGIYIHTFPNSPGLENRIEFNSIEMHHYNSALKLRDKYNVPFWDALMLSFYNRKDFSERILDNVLNSHAKRDKLFISRESLLSANSLRKFQFRTANYAFNSQVETDDGKRRHLLLLDFHIPESESNQIIVEKVLALIEAKEGYLMRSGKSYHFIGNNLISTNKLTSIVSKCLFFTPIVDKSWIAHQLIDRSCSLRFTKKRNVFPTLIKTIS